MTPEEFNSRLEQALREIETNRPKDAMRISFDLMAQVKARIQQAGTDSMGTLFPPYTPSYAKYGRIKKGYQSRIVDFTREGRLWASITPVVTQAGQAVTDVTLKPRDRENQDKLNGQYQKRGNILLPSEAEIAFARQANKIRIDNYLKQAGL